MRLEIKDKGKVIYQAREAWHIWREEFWVVFYAVFSGAVLIVLILNNRDQELLKQLLPIIVGVTLILVFVLPYLWRAFAIDFRNRFIIKRRVVSVERNALQHIFYKSFRYRFLHGLNYKMHYYYLITFGQETFLASETTFLEFKTLLGDKVKFSKIQVI
jgi:hypothetical protein